MLQKKISEIIRNLKRVRQENGLSISEIVRICEDSGNAVSETTIKKVFSDGSEALGFNYENTLKPIINALLDDHEETAETDMMVSVAQFKEAKIQALEAQLTRQEDSYKRRIEFLMQQIEIKDARLDKRDEMISKLIDSIINHTLCGGDK
ncbi:MAG: hypothetical protein IKH50_01700 [Oscillospiraceae bacterium]|nr:hypothetical protein [Oscillospiraceae bacterium]MBR6923231.1 hypothetical protein [Oscillospiraceae bacterium]